MFITNKIHLGKLFTPRLVFQDAFFKLESRAFLTWCSEMREALTLTYVHKSQEQVTADCTQQKVSHISCPRLICTGR